MFDFGDEWRVRLTGPQGSGILSSLSQANCLVALDRVALDPETVNNTLGVLLKYRDDLERVSGEEAERLVGEAKTAAAA